MNSFWLALAAYAEVARNYTHPIMKWAEDHQGLGGWVGAIGAVLAIFVTWRLARAEYRRAETRDHDRKNREIDLLKKIVSEFNTLMVDYFDRAAGGDPLLDKFHGRHMNDPEFHSMIDLAHIPVTQWPSIEAYVSFKNYWFYALKDLQNPIMTADVPHFANKSQLLFTELLTGLDGARRRNVRD